MKNVNVLCDTCIHKDLCKYENDCRNVTIENSKTTSNNILIPFGLTTNCNSYYEDKRNREDNASHSYTLMRGMTKL